MGGAVLGERPLEVTTETKFLNSKRCCFLPARLHAGLSPSCMLQPHCPQQPFWERFRRSRGESSAVCDLNPPPRSSCYGLAYRNRTISTIRDCDCHCGPLTAHHLGDGEGAIASLLRFLSQTRCICLEFSRFASGNSNTSACNVRCKGVSVSVHRLPFEYGGMRSVYHMTETCRDSRCQHHHPPGPQDGRKCASELVAKRPIQNAQASVDLSVPKTLRFENAETLRFLFRGPKNR